MSITEPSETNESQLPAREELDECLKANYGKFLDFACRFTCNRDDAKDLLHTAIERALERLHQYSPGTDIRGWVYAIIRNVFLNNVQQRSIRKRLIDIKIAESDITWESSQKPATVEPISSGVKNAILSLSQEFRHCILLAARGYSTQETADELGVPYGTVLSRTFRARKQILSKLDPAIIAEMNLA